MTNQNIINEGVDYPEDYKILSTTDLDSIITHVNKDFVDVCGYREDELIGKPHNLVRHPDMPKAAFGDLWATIKQGKSWMGLVKNRCKDGKYYWVNAFVTPIRRDGKICEYQSVRTKPSRQLTDRAQACYDAVNAGKSAKPKFGANIVTKLLLAWLISVMAVASIHFIPASLVPVAIIIAIGSFGLPLYRLHKRFSHMLSISKQVHDNPLNQFVYTGYTDELSHLELSLRMQKAEILAVIGRIKDSGEHLQQGLEEHQSQNQANQEQLVEQSSNLEQVVTAMGQMNASVNEIAQSTTSSTAEIHELVEQLAATKQALQDSQNATLEITQLLEDSSDSISALDKQCQSVNQALEVIESLAEQTNLLALNAAIEAARAGSAGRGFAVVADEVRNLATRSQSSAQEIHDIIDNLSKTTAMAVQQMGQGRELTEKSVSSDKLLEQNILSVADVMAIIEANGEQIAVAAEEQATVVNQIYASAQDLQGGIAQFEENCQASAHHSQEISAQGIRQTELVSQFN